MVKDPEQPDTAGPALQTANEPPVNPDAEIPTPPSTLDSGKVVKYIGMSDIREINEESWASLGSKSGFTRWERRNRWSVDAADLDDAALEYLDGDPEFSVTDAAIKRND